MFLRHRIQDLIDAGLLRFEKDESKVRLIRMHLQ